MMITRFAVVVTLVACAIRYDLGQVASGCQVVTCFIHHVTICIWYFYSTWVIIRLKEVSMQGGQKQDEVPDDHGVSSCKVWLRYRYRTMPGYFFMTRPLTRPSWKAIRVVCGGEGGIGGAHN